MKNNFKYLPLLLAISGILMFSGCGGATAPIPKVLNTSTPEEMVIFDPDDSILDLSERLEEMKKDKLSFYVPNSYRLVIEKFDWIKDYHNNGASEERLFKEIKETETLIESAYKRKKIINSKISSVVEHYNTLLSLKSNVYFTDRFESLSEDMKDMINEYDSLGGIFSSNEANLDALEDVPELNSDMLALEIDTVLAVEYTPNERKFAQIEDNYFNDFAPLTYRVAELKLIQFESYIRLNHLNKDGIAKMKASLIFEFNHLTHLVAEVKYINNTKESSEKVVLEQENKYLALMDALDIKDSRDKPLSKQYSIVLSGAKSLKATASAGLVDSMSKIAKQEEDISSLKEQIKAYKEQESASKATAKELNMEIVTLKVNSENLSKEVEKQKKALEKQALEQQKQELEKQKQKQALEKQALEKQKQEQALEKQKQKEALEKQTQELEKQKKELEKQKKKQKQELEKKKKKQALEKKKHKQALEKQKQELEKKEASVEEKKEAVAEEKKEIIKEKKKIEKE